MGICFSRCRLHVYLLRVWQGLIHHFTDGEEVKSAAQRAEERAQATAQEVRKANGVIERLQADLRGAKAKSKL